MKKFLIILTLSVITFLSSYNFVLALGTGKCTCDPVTQGGAGSVSMNESSQAECEEFCGEGVNAVFIEQKNNSSVSLDNPVGTTDISFLIGRIIKVFLGIIGSISLVMFLYAGFILMTAQGNSTKIKTGQDTMIWASVGILVVFASYTMLRFVFNVFRV